MCAADQGVIAREMARAVAFRLGHQAIFSPMPVADGTGNGVHVHFSLHGTGGAPATYDPNGTFGLSELYVKRRWHMFRSAMFQGWPASTSH